MSSRFRDQGLIHERNVVSKLRKLLRDDVTSTRQSSRTMDNQGVDVFLDYAKYPLYVQCKKHVQKQTALNIDAKPLLRLKHFKGIRVLWSKLTKHNESKESTIMTLVTVPEIDFMLLLEAYFLNFNKKLSDFEEMYKSTEDEDKKLELANIISDMKQFLKYANTFKINMLKKATGELRDEIETMFKWLKK